MTNTLDLRTLPLPELEIEDGQLVTDAILLVRSHLDGGRTRYTTTVTDGMDYAVALGMMQIGMREVEDGELFVTALGDGDEPV